LLAEYWCRIAPDVPNWTFYGSRQPTPAESLANFVIRVSEQKEVDVETFMLQASVDEEAKVIDIVAWHPALEEVPPEHHFQILFLLLDEALGEFGTQTWLGDIKVEPFSQCDTTKMLAELPEFVEQVRKYHEWEKPSPLNSYTLYEVPNQTNSRRGDTIVGTTCVPHVIGDFLEHNGKLVDNPFEGMGAELAYVAIDASVFPDGDQTEVRSNIEDALTDALESERSGRTLGGAFGTSASYIDLLLLDGGNSLRIVQDTLDGLQLQGRSRIEFFA
jgi:hypothetical protein